MSKTYLDSFGKHDFTTLVLFKETFLVEKFDNALHQVLVERFASLDQWHSKAVVNLNKSKKSLIKLFSK